MAEIFGRPLAEALHRVGTLGQFARIDSFVEQEGVSRGTRRLAVLTGGGLQFDVHPDRALDIGSASLDGVPLAWLSPTGFSDPRFAEPEGRGWLRTFGGGLLATCGLDAFGPAQDEDEGSVGMHGRIGQLPATVRRCETTSTELVIEGTVRQTRVFGENLVLHRRITSAIGSTSMTVDDTVTNEGATESPHMILYHVNVGWPLLDEGVRVDIPAARVTARDDDARIGFDERYSIGAPTPGFREQVYVHEAGSESYARVTNEERGIEFTLRYSSETLPAVFEWKMTDVGHYVLGLEPANTPEIMGRAAARTSGRLPILRPNESVRYRISFETVRL
ncbi:aldose 1-epimerase family protein [Sinomonas atrocyanea]